MMIKCKKQTIKSIPEDIIFASSPGSNKSSKQILDLALKSLTGSKRVMEILNIPGYKQGSKISLPDVPGPLEKSDGPPQFPH